MRAPEFWRRRGGFADVVLSPLGAAYSLAGAVRRRLTTPWRAPAPVICVGNLTVGGAGKTPTALALAGTLHDMNLRVAFLSRGYGGRLRGPVAVDAARHTARDVGDEPLLLAERAPTWVARNRKDGARLAIADGADVVVMDDGLQNPTLHQDLKLVVVDAEYGFGNGRVIPAGPLREPLPQGLARADAFVLVGEGGDDLARNLSRHAPVLRARLVPDAAARQLAQTRVYAFAGIGRPQKFFTSLEKLGAVIAGRRAFPDHHPYSEDEAMRVIETAAALGAVPVTTTKDAMRLPAAIRGMVTPLRVDLVFDDPAALRRLLQTTVQDLVRA